MSLFIKRPTISDFPRWLNQDERWHELGHYFAGYAILRSLELGYWQGIALIFVFSLFVEFIYQRKKLSNGDSWFDISTYLVSALICI